MRITTILAVCALAACMTVSNQPAAKPPGPGMEMLPVYAGWVALNGAGAQARTSNDDWHLQNDLSLALGKRVPLHWRDGKPAGYALELSRRNYPERGLLVLQLDVIEEATGKSLAYAWSDSNAATIGINLGWVQVGLQRTTTPPPAPKL
jgi:hypothetical protein